MERFESTFFLGNFTKTLLLISSMALSQSSFATNSQEFSIKPDTSVVILDVRGDECSFDDIGMSVDMQPPESSNGGKKAILNGVKLSMIAAQDRVQDMVDLIRSRIEKSAPACLEAVTNASNRPGGTVCTTPKKQISIFLDDSLKFQNERIFSLKNGKLLVTMAEGVTVKVIQIKKN